MALLYALIDPRTNETRYIGISTPGAWSRLGCHVQGARRGTAGRKNDWIRELLSDSRLPIPRVLAVLDSRREAYRCETAYIRALKVRGVPLTNETVNGGDRPKMIALRIPPELHTQMHSLAMRLCGETGKRVSVTDLFVEAMRDVLGKHAKHKRT